MLDELAGYDLTRIDMFFIEAISLRVQKQRTFGVYSNLSSEPPVTDRSVMAWRTKNSRLLLKN